jgi:hypothetical protein
MRALLEDGRPCSGVLQHAIVAVFGDAASANAICVGRGSFLLVWLFAIANDA